MSITPIFRRCLPHMMGAACVLFCSVIHPQVTKAQSQKPKSDIPYSTIAIPAALPPGLGTSEQSLPPGPGLTIVPTFNANIDSATQAVINNAITYFQKTIATDITVNIEFHNMNSGLGQSTFFTFTIPYSSYRNALGNNVTSPDDATALANTPSGSNNPVDGNTNIVVKSPSGRALGLGTPEQSFNFGGSPCPTFTGSGCIGLNVTLANSLGVLRATVEHEIDEVLGLGSALNGTTTPSNPFLEDLFRWGTPGVRSYAANSSSTNPCGGSTPAAFFSIDGGNTNLDQFNNCNNGGDYGDWITHTPSQVQDAITNASASPALLVSSPEIRALDVIGFNIAFRNFADTSVWRPSDGTWYVIPRDNPETSIAKQWGVDGDVPLRGDFDGDGISDMAVWRPSTGQWFVIPSSSPNGQISEQWGTQGDVPVPGDYDGDGITDFAVFRPSTGTWFIIPSANPGTPIVQQWGTNGDIPIPADYDGDHKTDIGVFRPSIGTWYIIPSGNPGNPVVQQWGATGDIPVPGDYDGDGKADLAVWRPSDGTWYIVPSSNPNSHISQPWGTNGDIPVPGDYDGDGKTDLAVWRPSTGVWYVLPTSSPGNTMATQWGTTGDVPIQRPIGQ